LIKGAYGHPGRLWPDQKAEIKAHIMLLTEDPQAVEPGVAEGMIEFLPETLEKIIRGEGSDVGSDDK
jgi:hypothetical protein